MMPGMMPGMNMQMPFAGAPGMAMAGGVGPMRGHNGRAMNGYNGSRMPGPYARNDGRGRIPSEYHRHQAQMYKESTPQGEREREIMLPLR